MQIKATVRHHLTSIGVAPVASIDEDVEYCVMLGGLQHVAAAINNSMDIPTKIKSRVSLGLQNPSFGCISKSDHSIKEIFVPPCLQWHD